MVAKPVGIRTVLSNIPFYTGHDGGDPRRYFRLGRFTMGNSDGFQMSHGLEYGQQLLYPMPPVWEILAYDIKDGASCLFQELVDVPTLSEQPWLRTPTSWERNAYVEVSGGAGDVTSWSYTVPTGFKLYVTQMRAGIVRTVAAASTTYGTVGQITTGGGAILCRAKLHLGAASTSVIDQVGSVQIFLQGTVLTATYANYDTGGTVQVGMSASGLLFVA